MPDASAGQLLEGGRLMQVNTVDTVILGAILISVGIGYIQGFLRQAFTLLGLYVATILATQYHAVVGEWVGWVFVTDAAPRASVAFLLVFFVAVLFLGWLSRRAYPAMRLTKAGVLDNLAGASLGLVTGAIVVIVAGAGLHFAVSTPWPDYDPFRVSLAGQVHTSLLLPMVSSYAPMLFSTLNPWFPGGLPAIIAQYV